MEHATALAAPCTHHKKLYFVVYLVYPPSSLAVVVRRRSIRYTHVEYTQLHATYQYHDDIFFDSFVVVSGKHKKNLQVDLKHTTMSTPEPVQTLNSKEGKLQTKILDNSCYALIAQSSAFLGVAIFMINPKEGVCRGLGATLLLIATGLSLYMSIIITQEKVKK
jgi:hypothetical protein